MGSGEIIVTGDHWPMFLYSESHYDEDNPWKGLLRNSLLVKVGLLLLISTLHSFDAYIGIQAHFHISQLR